MSDHKIAMLKLASFLVVATLLTSGLSLYLLNHRGAINTDGFMEASRFVSNLLSPAKAPQSPMQGEQPVVQAEPPEETFSNGKIIDGRTPVIPSEIPGSTAIPRPSADDGDSSEGGVRRLSYPVLDGKE